MPDPKIYEGLVFGIVLILGTMTGLLLEVGGNEPDKPWRVVLSSAVLNGMFTVGVLGILRYWLPNMPIEAAAAIAAGSSTIGRSVILRLIHLWLKR